MIMHVEERVVRFKCSGETGMVVRLGSVRGNDEGQKNKQKINRSKGRGEERKTGCEGTEGMGGVKANSA